MHSASIIFSSIKQLIHSKGSLRILKKSSLSVWHGSRKNKGMSLLVISNLVVSILEASKKPSTPSDGSELVKLPGTGAGGVSKIEPCLVVID